MILRRLLPGLALALAMAVLPASAQDPEAPNYSRWEAVAQRGEETLAGAGASDLALDALRGELARFREEFLAAQNINASRIKTASDQLSALGAAPAEGETEPRDIAARRAELDAQLAELRAPVLAAVEAFERADGLIGEIDSLVRERQTQRLLARGPSPLWPQNWTPSLAQLSDALTGLWLETSVAIANPTDRAAFRSNLPAIIFFGLVAVGMIGFGRPLARRAQDYLAATASSTNRSLVDFTASLPQVVVPLVGVYALVEALTLTSFANFRAAHIVEVLPLVGLVLFGTIWLARRTFPANDLTRALLPLEAGQRRDGRLAALTIALAWIALFVARRLDRFGEFTDATQSVLALPALTLAGVALYRIGRLMRRAGMSRDDAGEETTGYGGRLVRLLGRAAVVIGVVGPIICAIGYRTAAEALVFPAAMTLALLAGVRIVQLLVGDLWVVAARGDDTARDGLMPLLIGLALAMGALPLLALIWGARAVDLAEVWARLSEGVTIGATRISPSDFLTFAVVFAIGYAATRLLQGTLRTTVLPKTSIEPGARNAIVSGLGYVGIFLAGLIAITATGIDMSSLAIVAGALSIGVGFGLQNIVSNFVSGIILLIERPISEGDMIEVGGQMGIVKKVSVRSTRIETFARTDVIVPNADFVSGQVTNWTRGNTFGRVTVTVGVAYGADSRRVEELLREICGGHPEVEPEPNVFFTAFGADALEFNCYCILRDVGRRMFVLTEINHQIHERFRAEGIEIPFAQRDVWLRNPEALSKPGIE